MNFGTIPTQEPVAFLPFLSKIRRAVVHKFALALALDVEHVIKIAMHRADASGLQPLVDAGVLQQVGHGVGGLRMAILAELTADVSSFSLDDFDRTYEAEALQGGVLTPASQSMVTVYGKLLGFIAHRRAKALTTDSPAVRPHR